MVDEDLIWARSRLKWLARGVNIIATVVPAIPLPSFLVAAINSNEVTEGVAHTYARAVRLYRRTRTNIGWPTRLTAIRHRIFNMSIFLWVRFVYFYAYNS